MHELTVRWDHCPQDGDDLNAFGRNGMFRCAGIHAYDLGGRIILRPLTGKGFPARGASIDLPADAAKLREIAAGLSAIAEQLEPGQPAPATNQQCAAWAETALADPPSPPRGLLAAAKSALRVLEDWDDGAADGESVHITELRVAIAEAEAGDGWPTAPARPQDTTTGRPLAQQPEQDPAPPPPVGSGPGILRVLDMSTAHLSEQSCLWLEGREYGDSRELPVVAPTEYGWLLWVPDKATEADGDGIAAHGPHSEKPWPEDVCRVLRFAQARSCAYLLLDAEGPHWDGLWSESPDTNELDTALPASIMS